MGDTMIESLYIENFAIIDQVQIDFQSGMTVLTGETGAGKSIIIDAIGQEKIIMTCVLQRTSLK